MPRYWLAKTEPTSYSIDDLESEKQTSWTGVRNFQARNFLRDSMSIGDGVLFYHSSCTVPAIVGLARVASAPYPDSTAFDPDDHHFDPKSTHEKPTWYTVDISFEKKFKIPLRLEDLKKEPELDGLTLIKKGSRLSVQPVSEAHFKILSSL